MGGLCNYEKLVGLLYESSFMVWAGVWRRANCTHNCEVGVCCRHCTCANVGQARRVKVVEDD
jgi:hypothetical protein